MIVEMYYLINCLQLYLIVANMIFQTKKFIMIFIVSTVTANFFLQKYLTAS
jgi:hypothetical protein